MRLPKILTFEWDKGNVDKGYQKHGVSPKEAEEAFVSEDLKVLPDRIHSKPEEIRHIALGQTQESKNLFVVFAIRNNKIRIISARRMHKKEVQKYKQSI